MSKSSIYGRLRAAFLLSADRDNACQVTTYVDLGVLLPVRRYVDRRQHRMQNVTGLQTRRFIHSGYRNVKRFNLTVVVKSHIRMEHWGRSLTLQEFLLQFLFTGLQRNHLGIDLLGSPALLIAAEK